MSAPRRIAVVGGGISGLGAAWRLHPHAEVTLFEAEPRLGGHAHTVDLSLRTRSGLVEQGVDTGFLVFNQRTYPQLVALFSTLGIDCAASEMSFSVQAPRATGGQLEWSGTDLNGVFADRRNLWRPRFHGMLFDLLRFNRLATALALRPADAEMALPLADFLARHRFGRAFREDYLLPMIGCIWSCATDQMLRFPVGTLVRFCHNHGLLQVRDRPQWYTVRGGSRRYVERMATRVGRVRAGTPVLEIVRSARADGAAADTPPRDAVGEIPHRPAEAGPAPAQPGRGHVGVRTAGGLEWFDAVVLACHAPQALALLPQASADERRVLAAIAYQDNEAVLHTDEALLPQRRAAWAAWNYERGPMQGTRQGQGDGDSDGAGRVCLHYLLNRLQPLPWSQSVILSLNPLRAPRKALVLERFHYAHPVFDRAAIAAQGELACVQGRGGVWFCGAWTGYGFHEDGLRSGLEIADRLLGHAAPPMPRPDRAVAALPEAA